jgi:hypothetical protein
MTWSPIIKYVTATKYYQTYHWINIFSRYILPFPNKFPKSTSSFFLIWFVEAIGTAATPGLLCQPRVIVKMIVEKQMECRLAEETEVLGENLPQRHFCPSQNPT